MSAFVEAYKAVNPILADKGVPHLTMNAPVVADSQPGGKIGIEMEIEGRNLINGGRLDGVRGETSGAVWQAKEDGSLRGGMEYVLSRPCTPEEVSGLVSGFFDRARTADMIINNTNRCSTHVHINVGGLKVNHITSILALWSVFETAFINYCGEERKTNHFCLASTDEDSFVEAWVDFLRTGTIPTVRNLKYTALNILPIWNFGSIEFRCGAAAEDAESVSQWVAMLWALCSYATEHYPNPHQVAFDLSERGATAMLQDILTPEQAAEVIEPYEAMFDAICLESFRNAQPFVLGFPWDKWQAEIDKEYVPNPFAKPTRAPKAYRLVEGGPVPRHINA